LRTVAKTCDQFQHLNIIIIPFFYCYVILGMGSFCRTIFLLDLPMTQSYDLTK
jgi:hypothetical protein